MPKLPRIPSFAVIKVLKKAGFYLFYQSRSHVQFRHYVKINLRLTVPFHKKDLAPKTLKSIIKQAGMTVEEFLDLI